MYIVCICMLYVFNTATIHTCMHNYKQLINIITCKIYFMYTCYYLSPAIILSFLPNSARKAITIIYYYVIN